MRKSLALFLVPIIAVMGACGSDDDSADSADAPAATAAAADPTTVATSASADEPAASTEAPAPTTPATSAPAPAEGVSLPSGTIGVLQIQGAAEAVARISSDIETANSAMGWETIVTDGKGNPAVMGQAMTDFIARGVDAIITIAVDSPIIAPQIEQAAEAGIPVLSAPFTVTDPNGLYNVNMGPSTDGYVASMAEYLVAKYPSGTKFVAVDVPAVGSAHEFTVGIQAALSEAGFVDEGSADADPADIVNSFTTATQNVLQAHPEAQILVSCCDFSPPIQLPIVKATGRDDVLVTGRFDNLSSLALFADNGNLAVGAANMTTGVLRALDAIYAFTASGTPIPTSDDQSQYEFAVVDASNVPASGAFYFDPSGQIDTFVAKWQSEYTS
jgi:ABC-type sugar transport system substrate-binding protein